MFIEERLKLILERLREEESLSVEQIGEFLNVSKDTVRRDLRKLEARNLVTRTHGGVMRPQLLAFEPTFEERNLKYSEEKLKISKKAASLVRSGDIIFIDAGTTTEGMIDFLKDINNLTIITNALNVALKTVPLMNITTIILGGLLRKGNLSTVGPDTEDILREYHASKAFLGVSAIKPAFGLMTPNRYEAEIKKLMIKSAFEVYILSDHSKLNRIELVSFAPLDEKINLISDGQVPDAIIREYEAYGARFILA